MLGGGDVLAFEGAGVDGAGAGDVEVGGAGGAGDAGIAGAANGEVHGVGFDVVDINISSAVHGNGELGDPGVLDVKVCSAVHFYIERRDGDASEREVAGTVDFYIYRLVGDVTVYHIEVCGPGNVDVSKQRCLNRDFVCLGQDGDKILGCNHQLPVLHCKVKIIKHFLIGFDRYQEGVALGEDDICGALDGYGLEARKIERPFLHLSVAGDGFTVVYFERIDTADVQLAGAEGHCCSKEKQSLFHTD